MESKQREQISEIFCGTDQSMFDEHGFLKKEFDDIGKYNTAMFDQYGFLRKEFDHTITYPIINGEQEITVDDIIAYTKPELLRSTSTGLLIESTPREDIESDIEEDEDEEKIDLSENTVEPKTDGLRAVRYWLTYSSHLNKDRVETFFKGIEKLKGGQAVNRIAVCHENGKNKGSTKAHAHTHVYVKFVKRLNITRQGCMHTFCMDPEPGYTGDKGKGSKSCGKMHTNVVYLKQGKANDIRVLCYASKEDPECAELVRPWLAEMGTTLEAELNNCVGNRVKDVPLKDAIFNLKNPCHVPGTIMAHRIINGGRPKMTQVPYHMHKWQVDLEKKMVSNYWDRGRDIVWIFHEVGKKGKSKFARYMAYHHWDDVMHVTCAMGAKDLATAVRGRTENGWTGKYFIYDLARSELDYDMYRGMEALKNGAITASKYEGGTAYFEESLVIVFANFPPKVWSNGRETVSHDRWKIYEIDSEKDELKWIHFGEAQRIRDRLIAEDKKDPFFGQSYVGMNL